MFIPIFMAILLGLINPSHTNNCNSAGTVYVNAAEPDPGDPGEGDGEGGEDDGTDGPGSSGNTSQVPPPKP